MTAEEYKIKFDKIKRKRRPEPTKWWITANHKENIKSPIIQDTIKMFPNNYKRELAYQKALEKITKERLKDAMPYKVGQKVKVLNCYERRTDDRLLKHIEVRKPNAMLNVEIVGKPQISFYGNIMFTVNFKYKPKEHMVEIAGQGLKECTEGYFPVYQDEIINK